MIHESWSVCWQRERGLGPGRWTGCITGGRRSCQGQTARTSIHSMPYHHTDVTLGLSESLYPALLLFLHCFLKSLDTTLFACQQLSHSLSKPRTSSILIWWHCLTGVEVDWSQQLCNLLMGARECWGLKWRNVIWFMALGTYELDSSNAMSKQWVKPTSWKAFVLVSSQTDGRTDIQTVHTVCGIGSSE